SSQLHLLFYLYLFFIMTPPPPSSTLFPYTTLFRSCHRTSGQARCPSQSRSSHRRVHLRAQRPVTAPPCKSLDRGRADRKAATARSEEHTSELQSRGHLVCRLLLEKKKKQQKENHT